MEHLLDHGGGLVGGGGQLRHYYLVWRVFWYYRLTVLFSYSNEIRRRRKRLTEVVRRNCCLVMRYVVLFWILVLICHARFQLDGVSILIDGSLGRGHLHLRLLRLTDELLVGVEYVLVFFLVLHHHVRFLKHLLRLFEVLPMVLIFSSFLHIIRYNMLLRLGLKLRLF